MKKTSYKHLSHWACASDFFGNFHLSELCVTIAVALFGDFSDFFFGRPEIKLKMSNCCKRGRNKTIQKSLEIDFLSLKVGGLYPS